jgi:Arc/MetJ-type ribon-helix-helix transcriptional regulator
MLGKSVPARGFMAPTLAMLAIPRRMEFGRRLEMLEIQLKEDLDKLLRAEVESGRFASVDEAIDLALRRLLKPPPPEGPLTEEQLLQYMYEIGEITHLPDRNADLDDDDDEELIEIEGEPLSETIIRGRG